MLKIIKFTLYYIMMFIVMLGILKFEVTAIEKVMIYIFKKTCKIERDLKNRLFTKKSIFYLGCCRYGGSCAKIWKERLYRHHYLHRGDDGNRLKNGEIIWKIDILRK